ncbi:tetratricopeptide repeat protein [uncultured Erythrobacter sp.]|uniref:tetratricopeptide repeat protein n=1 Tax=uncultured Erythrobacter sp. TaxID=263913 RepID=UPI002606B494|nr:tetratricopeptide repeat protein [uncultured Erythrobacter sp.]
MKWPRSLSLGKTREAKALISKADKASDQQHWEEAAENYRRALEINPDLAPIWVQLGHTEKESGAFVDAVEAYKRASSLTPRDPDAFFHLAFLLERMDRVDEAIAAWRQVLRLAPDNLDAAARLQNLSLEDLQQVRLERQRDAIRAHRAGRSDARSSSRVVARLEASTSANDVGVTSLPGGRVAAWLMLPDTLPENPIAGLWAKGELIAISQLADPIPGSQLDLVFDLPTHVRAAEQLELGVSLLSLADMQPPLSQWVDVSLGRAANAYQSTFALPPTTPLKELGIIVFGFTRTRALEAVLESLHRQGASAITEVWIDGHQENAKLKPALLESANLAARYPLANLTANEGNFGFRKMMLLGLQHMTSTYEKFIVLEDDCFPTRNAVDVFHSEIERISDDKRIFSVYGHPFLTPSETETCARFQGWGWGTTSQKMLPILNELTECFSMTESQYLDFVTRTLTPEIEQAINVTPGRQPTDTLRRFFAWDETVCLLAARRGLAHKPTNPRVIYNFGMGTDGTHFDDIDVHRNPPFNMISLEEVWDVY